MNLANKISITRVILIPFFITSLMYARMEWALVLFIIAVVSDGVDGYIARTHKQKTYLGTIIDPVADKLLLVSAFISLAMVKNIPDAFKFPPYVPVIVISRDVIIVVGSIMIYMLTGDLKVRPTLAGKTTTFFQMITIISVLANFRYSALIWNSAVILTVISGVDYVVRGAKLLSNNNNHIKETSAL